MCVSPDEKNSLVEIHLTLSFESDLGLKPPNTGPYLQKNPSRDLFRLLAYLNWYSWFSLKT